MEFTIINPAESSLVMGSRLISSMLKEAGHKVNMIFVTEKINSNIANEIVEISKNSNYICFSFMTMNYNMTCQISHDIKRKLPHIPIIWGGIHATLCPDECKNYADIVCVGDGEEFFINLANNQIKIPNNKIVFGGMISNLNQYPPADFDLDNKWITQDGKLIPIDYELQKKQFESDYLRLKDGSKSYCYTTQSSRGCPHRCHYCSNPD